MAETVRADRDEARALAPGPALALACRLLAGHGWHEVARNARGDSLYLAREGDPGRLRLSNHARTPKQRRVHPEVLASLVIRQPRTRAQVAALVAAALRDAAGGLRRRDARGDQAGTGSRSGAEATSAAISTESRTGTPSGSA